MNEMSARTEQSRSGHVPVLFTEALEGLNVQHGIWYLDVTFGRGGHTRGILEKGGNVVAFDTDKEAISYGKQHFKQEIQDGQLILVHGNFEFVEQHVARIDGDVVGKIGGVLADFGVSSNQLEQVQRGFSFQHDAPLDMRMSDELTVTAKDLVNGLGKQELYRLFTEFAQEQHAKTIVSAIIEARKRKPIETTQGLARIIEKKVGRRGRLHPATKVFMALRMLVNDELGVIERMLPQAFGLLRSGGRLVTISFHEGEDRIVKQFMKRVEDERRGILLTKRPIEAREQEIKENPRSRSGKLRVIEKTL